MTDPLHHSALAASTWADVRRSWAGLVVFEFVFKLLEAWLFVPAVAVVLSAALATSGQVAVTNRDLLDFLLSPVGLLYAGFFAILTWALLLVEQSAVMLLAARKPMTDVLFHAPRVVGVAAIQLALLTLALAPLALVAFLAYQLLLSRHDINFYLAERPPRFWFAAVMGGVALVAALALVVWLYVRWAFTLPILLFEKQSPLASLRGSRQRVRGAAWRVGNVLVGWQLGSLLVGAAVEAGFRPVAGLVLADAGERPSGRVALLLVSHGAMLAAWSFVTAVGLALLTRRLYLSCADEPAPEPAARQRRPSTVLACLAAGFALTAPLLVWWELPGRLKALPELKVTAHRGHSLAAPENTLRAVEKAIESGADYAEVDVQRTADGIVILLHDRDLKRVAGDLRRPEELTYEQLRELDVGRWFGPSFVGERAPSLADVIRLAKGRIKLNIELKVYGPDVRVAADTARLVREMGFESDCLVTSFRDDALAEVRRHNPRLRTGLIVAQALGDVSRLDGEALSVRADWLSDDVLRSAHRAGKEVHVWTVNDARQMARLLKRGVDNLITDDPDLAVRVRGEWADLTPPEQLLLASRLLLGLDP